MVTGTIQVALQHAAGTRQPSSGFVGRQLLGIILRGLPKVCLQASIYTTDVEVSLRCCCLDGIFHIFLGVTALHKYRSV